ncbi:PSD1 and planctomycete cytochrome C domain-containing protein [Rubinisphaera margarita]|uniref:PSD1 and planctomycete cytochrome C domain-containing protein n=1 Tax=Rubinisphaera margarita TaxID=2909586 RepID=UPI001EE9898E|nr:PSD1 and planctomycete cytochrome C domain-containing protein [Rubinisphaera margarita]MCG6156568.1 PSD1 and planctomycete cytochrome C domain-containing protein [Rubinisphaera margarita]
MTRTVAPARRLSAAVFALVNSLAFCQLGTAEESRIDFNQDVIPILSDNCYACHGQDEEQRAAELRLDNAIDATADRDGSPAIVPGNPEASLVWERISTSDTDLIMPPAESHKKLTADQKEVIRRWIEEGAEYREHWAYVAPKKTELPASEFDHPIDAFLDSSRRERDLPHNERADRRTLIRRVTLDLTGLPPTLDEVRDFVADERPKAYEHLVDRLLKTPAYGENMARSWLDLARYADTHGLHLDNIRSMWPYRDWVVQAFNNNVPFDEFTRWQLAGDLLPDSTREQQIASGFNRCNVSTSEGGSINEEWIYRYAVDRTSTMAEVWMGMTAGCAVCHDHKFDPLSTHEYYSLYAFFHSAADPAMDGNKEDTPPVLKLYSEEEKAVIAALRKDLETVELQVRKAVTSFDYSDPATIEPTPKPEETETVWFEDGFPSGANVQSSGAPLKLISSGDGPVLSGDKALQRTAGGLEQDFFSSGAEFSVPSGGTIFTHCYLDPENLPEAIMVQFHTDGWKHRAVWGTEEKIPFGKSDSTEKVLMGELPEAGRWVRLEVPAAKMGLKPGQKITGYAFTQFAGTVSWDRLGVVSKIDRANDPSWSFEVWKKKNQGKRNNDLPDDLRNLVRGKQPAQWSDDEARQIYEFWIENFYAGVDDDLTALKSKKTRLQTEIDKKESDVPVTLVMADLNKPRESFVMIRGAYDKPGDKVSRTVPAFLPPLPESADGDYDRLDLANWLVSGTHPLTARVTVNRFWQQFFGTGIVKTSGDFGLQGEPPVHPELLDWLAVDFVEHDWDIKRLIKFIVTSEAYCQDSTVTPSVLERDPENRHLARGPRLRLSAEVLRDQALFHSGLLVDKMGGEGVFPYQPDNIWEPVAFGGSNTRFYKQSTGEDLYRRSLYTFLKRTAPPPFMSTFDAPSREQSCTRRERTNTPLQALQLMNDVQYFEAARAFAERMMKAGGSTPESRLAWGWEVTTSRPPTDNELSLVASLLKDYRERYQNDAAGAKEVITFGESKPDEKLDPSELAAYTLVANLLLNLDETINKN